MTAFGFTSKGNTLDIGVVIIHKAGCANNPGCRISEKVDPLYISDKLNSGQNVIAVQVSESGGGEYFDLSFYIRPKR